MNFNTAFFLTLTIPLLLSCVEERKAASPEKRKAAQELRRHYPNNMYAGWGLGKIEVPSSVILYFTTGYESERLLKTFTKEKQRAYLRLACPPSDDPIFKHIDGAAGERVTVDLSGPNGFIMYADCQ